MNGDLRQAAAETLLNSPNTSAFKKAIAKIEKEHAEHAEDIFNRALHLEEHCNDSEPVKKALEAAISRVAKAPSAKAVVIPAKGKPGRQAPLPLTGESTGPDWTRARAYMEGIKTFARLSLAGQILLGHELQTLKVELGFAGRGGDRRSKPQFEVLKSLNRTWDQWCKSELGISDSTADRIIATYEAAKNKLRKLGGQPLLIGMLDTSPTKIPDEQRKALAMLVDRLEWGESQSQLLADFGITKKPSTLTGGSQGKPAKKQDANVGQMAFAFFAKVPESVGKLAKTVGNLRLSPDYNGYLAALPLSSPDPGKPSLESLEALLEAAISGDLPKLLADIKAAKEARTQSAAA